MGSTARQGVNEPPRCKAWPGEIRFRPVSATTRPRAAGACPAGHPLHDPPCPDGRWRPVRLPRVAPGARRRVAVVLSESRTSRPRTMLVHSPKTGCGASVNCAEDAGAPLGRCGCPGGCGEHERRSMQSVGRPRYARARASGVRKRDTARDVFPSRAEVVAGQDVPSGARRPCESAAGNPRDTWGTGVPAGRDT